MEKEITGLYSLSIAYMELLPKFYKAVWPYCNSDSYFRNQFMTERSRQYETNVKVRTLQQKLDFKKGDNPGPCGKYFTTSCIPRASDVAVLSKQLDQLTSLKAEVKKLKNEEAW